MKIILTLISLIVLDGIIYPQINEITKLPLENFSEQIIHTTPLWISENDILIFFSSGSSGDQSYLDTIYSVRSTDRGNTWSNRTVQIIDTTNYSRMTNAAIKTKDNRILQVWSNPYVTFKLIYSDDFGSTWSDPVSFVVRDPIPLRFPQYFSFTQLTSGEIILSFSRNTKNYCIKSTDGGLTWQTDEPFIYRFGENLSILEMGVDSLLAVYSFNDSIFSKTSTDNGISWSDSSFINALSQTNNSLHVTKRADGSLVIVYDAFTDSLPHYQYANDIIIKESFDKGMSWTNAVSFTQYLGNDESSNIASLNNDVFITFFSERDPGIYYGILNESEDKFTPPILKSSKTVNIDYENEKLGFQAEVIDDEGVSSVIARIEQINLITELFDDGMHNDSLANDNIFGNTLPFITEGYHSDAYAMDLNNISLPFSSKGVIADMNIEYKGGFSFELEMTDISGNVGLTGAGVLIPIRGGGGSMGKFEEGAFLWSGGFFLSGYSNGQMWSNAVASAMLAEDYLPGLIDGESYNVLDGIYVVNKRDPAFGYTWQKWKDAVSLGAEFYDGDGDGIYNPVDKNWNGTWELSEDMPPLIGDEIAWCVYNDGLPRIQRRWNTVEPQGIEVRQTIFATDNPELENVIFIRYSILNKGMVAEVMDSVYFGIWEDADVGDPNDDVVGCDTLLQSGFYYSDIPDLGYGDNPPAFFSTFLQGPIINTNNVTDTAKNNFGQQLGSELFSNSKNQGITSHVFFIGGVPNLSNPATAEYARNYLLGKDRLGNYPNPCNFTFGQVRGGVDCHQVNPHFWLSGDPVTDVGWISTQNRDTRNLVSTGPFHLEKDKPQEIIIAYVIGRGTDPLNSITVARENVQRAIQEYKSNFASMTYIPPSATNPVNSYMLYQNYPNPFNPTTTIRYELPQDGVVTIELFDILGQKVKTLLNEFQKADRYEVTLNSAGLASGVYIYQLSVNDYITSKKMVLIR